MSDGDGNHPQDEDVEYLEQLLCEQIRSVHDAGFQRLEKSLRDAINGLEKARKGLDDLVQRDLDKALKKLVRTVPDEVAQVVTQVVREHLPADYGNLVKDAELLSSKVREVVKTLEDSSNEFEYLAQLKATIDSLAAALGLSFEELAVGVRETKVMFGRIEDQAQGSSGSLATLNSTLKAINNRIDARERADTERTHALTGVVTRIHDSSASGLQLLQAVDKRIASRDEVGRLGREVAETKTLVLGDLGRVCNEIAAITLLGRKIDSDSSQRAQRLETARAEATSYYSNLSTLIEKIADNLQKKQADAVAKYTSSLATTEKLQHLVGLTHQVRTELPLVLGTLDEKIVGVANLARALVETADLIIRNLHNLGVDLERASCQAAEEREIIKQLISMGLKEVDGSVSNMAQALSEELRRARTTLSNDADTAFSGLNERIGGAIAQISALNLALANTDAALRVHIGDWKREITYAKKVSEETRTLVSVFFAFVALIVSAVPICAAVWWWFQK